MARRAAEENAVMSTVTRLARQFNAMDLENAEEAQAAQAGLS
jgi:hypothetical protein